MSLNKAIQHGKEHRAPYRRSKQFDKTCRNHGTCSYCQSNRQHSTYVKKAAADAQLKELAKMPAE